MEHNATLFAKSKEHVMALVERAKEQAPRIGKAGRQSGGVGGIAVGILLMVILTIIVGTFITNLTASGSITGWGLTLSPFIVPLMWVGALVLAAKMAR